MPTWRKEPPQVMTVLGPVQPEGLGITDAHNHLWIEAVPGSAAGSPVLDSYGQILAELEDYRRAGGTSILDCQPGGCGRDGRRLAGLSRDSGVRIVACTGFHRRQYYPPDHWLWRATAEQAAQSFLEEATHCVEESRQQPEPVRAGFIKIACEATVRETPQAPTQGAAAAAASTGLALMVHTERGADVESIIESLSDLGVTPTQLVLCHMDKRPDLALHRELASTGAMLEYDTFFRPKYDPEVNLWRLIEGMAAAGLTDHLALATDMAENDMWNSFGGTPGLPALLTHVVPRLHSLGLGEGSVRGLVGGNIARRLAGLETSSGS